VSSIQTGSTGSIQTCDATQEQKTYLQWRHCQLSPERRNPSNKPMWNTRTLYSFSEINTNMPKQTGNYIDKNHVKIQSCSEISGVDDPNRPT